MQEELQWTARVRTQDRRGAVVYARKQRFEVGAPLAFDVEAERTSALEYALGALGADLAVGLKARCEKRRLDVGHVEVVVKGALDNPLVYLDVVGEEGSPRLARLDIKAFVETLEDEFKVQETWEETLRRAPLLQTLAPLVELNLSLQISL